MIKNKIYYYIRMKLLSPISVGNGDDFLTDHDCIKNSKGIPFIPGSTLAGVFLHYLSNENKEIFIPKINDEFKQSPYFISDANVYKENHTDRVNTSIRDGIKLDENKITEDGAKFDFEIVETGTTFDFRIEITIRENDNIEKMKKVVDIILNGINNGEVLFGYKSKRGYGKAKIIESKVKEFNTEDLENLILFDKYDINNYDDYSIAKENNESKYDYIKVELKQLGGISIKRYSARAGEVDFEHITSNGKPVIPGTSWNGLIKSQIKKYLENDILYQSGIILTEWFGKEKGKETEGKASNVIIEESEIKNATKIELTRNKIDRFSGGVSDKALFSEVAYYNGETTLGIKVKKSIKEDEDNSRIIGLIALVIKDIDNGLIALGGQTAIGRGMFKVMEATINGESFDLDNAIEKIIGGALIG